MAGLVRKLSPILAGIAVASGLYAVLWRQVGAPYYAIYDDPTTRLARLFVDHLMAGLIAIAVAAGLVCGAIKGAGRLTMAPVRGAVAAALFGIITFASYIFHDPCTPAAVHDLLAQHSFLQTLAYALLLAVVIAAFGLIGSAPYAAVAAVSASLGEFLREKHKGHLILSICLACCATLGIAMIQGASVRSALRALTQASRRAEPLVRQNLVDLPPSPHWRPSGARFTAEALAADCDIPDGTVSVEFGTDGRMESASLHLMTPKGVSLRTKEAALAFLRRHGVRDKAIATLRQRSHGQWVSRSGDYSVLVNKWYPPRD